MTSTPMRNAVGHPVNVRRASGTYRADDGDVVDVHPNDVRALTAIGFVPVVETAPDDLDDLPVDRLRTIAAERDLEGRSSMNKGELVAALRATEG